MVVDEMQDGMSHRGTEDEWPCRLPDAARQRARVASESEATTRALDDSASPNMVTVTWHSTESSPRSAHGGCRPVEQYEAAENDARCTYAGGIEVHQRDEGGGGGAHTLLMTTNLYAHPEPIPHRALRTTAASARMARGIDNSCMCMYT